VGVNQPEWEPNEKGICIPIRFKDGLGEIKFQHVQMVNSWDMPGIRITMVCPDGQPPTIVIPYGDFADTLRDLFKIPEGEEV